MALIGRFPGSQGFILRVRKGPFLRAEASLLDTPGITVIVAHRSTHVAHCTHPVHGREAMYTRIYHPGR